jgi:hypothetical protein
LKVSIDTIEEQANQSMKFIFQKHHQKNGMGFFETAEKEIRFAI